MPEFLKAPFINGPEVVPLDVCVRLLLALVFGVAVAWIYKHIRSKTQIASTFPATLVFLSVLIAMVTQVIGDNVARAFSLVGALSIVRFRTVVRDTQDTAYVIFAVIVGMAVGAKNLWVGFIGVVVMAIAAAIMMIRDGRVATLRPEFMLSLRMEITHDVEKIIGSVLNQYLQGRELISIGTAKQGASLDVVYLTRLKPDASADELVKTLNRISGIQSVQYQQRGFDLD